ncbi:cysteine-rich receptor-like protein kinase 8 [Tanacetum coccineum]|uniref:Cysteine-rich receptor-like protein kinase 8 n=1 Tax=Tanacetum coccineum TaxID=301880 RepID=A0ABQ5BRX8_9ASTR
MVNTTQSQTTNTTIPSINDDDTNSPNHPLFLHQHDHPDLILISKKLTGSDNYGSWKRSMMIALNAKNKLKIVTSEHEKPTIDLVHRAIWERTNDMIISWILNTIDEHIVQLKQNTTSIEIYYHKLKGVWDEYDSLEAPYLCVCASVSENGRINSGRDQRKRPIQFLMGLDKCYKNVRGLITQGLKDTITVKEILQRTIMQLKQPKEEAISRRVPHSQTLRNNIQDNNGNRTVNMAMTQGISIHSSAANASNDATMNARMDQLQNQLNQMIIMMQNNKETTSMPFMSSEGKPELIASHITRSNKFIASHISARRYRVIASVLINPRYLWVVDSGATDFVCISITLMHNIQLYTQPIYVTLPIDQNTLVIQTRSMYINSAITLHNDHRKRIAHVSLYNGLYIIKQEPKAPTFTVLTINSNNVAL